MADELLELLEGGPNDNNLQAIARAGAGVLKLSVENPMAGDSETGFGFTCHMDLDRANARRLRDFLTRWLSEG